MPIDSRALLERLAEHGTAPSEGCSLIGVGYEQAFEQLKDTYLVRRFERGGAGEKFVIGPFGSGKTHFLRQLLEIARDIGCVTSEVQLNKDVDFRQSLVVYREVARELRCGDRMGMGGLLRGCLEKVTATVDRLPAEQAEQARKQWIVGLRGVGFKLPAFGRVARVAFEALDRSDEDLFDDTCRWLGGEVNDRALCRALGMTPVPRAQHAAHARGTLPSLFQLVRHAGIRGTVVGFDEAEQGLSVDRMARNHIFSVLQSEINAMADLEDASALIVYAFTPDLLEDMASYAALQQRVTSPGRGFFDGNTYAPVIDLTQRADPAGELEQIGMRLLGVAHPLFAESTPISSDELESRMRLTADTVLNLDHSVSNRRTFVRRLCWQILYAIDYGRLPDFEDGPSDAVEDEV